ncbi:hypothetical protein GALMADRAFT_225670 [Galerina marginata CBS 339.88]|uniref:Uncharacterized protein n=1 Tax=Galerina marginata (strain CBS 339.88) TaxID=685588 RepID=A0A067T332_GALM3|nr:hypothetical protein GALMADRAFT_225670 [Galerina marginata CBS 339.88]
MSMPSSPTSIHISSFVVLSGMSAPSHSSMNLAEHLAAIAPAPAFVVCTPFPFDFQTFSEGVGWLEQRLHESYVFGASVVEAAVCWIEGENKTWRRSAAQHPDDGSAAPNSALTHGVLSLPPRRPTLLQSELPRLRSGPRRSHLLCIRRCSMQPLPSRHPV